MLYNTAFRMTALAGVLSLALSACGGSGGNTVTENGGTPGNGSGGSGGTSADIGGDTSGYSGRLAWGANALFYTPEMRVWDMAKSEYILYEGAGEDTVQNYLFPSLSANQEALSYTFLEPLTLMPSQVHLHDLENDIKHIVPTLDVDGRFRGAMHSDVTSDGTTVVFIDTIYNESVDNPGYPGEKVSYGISTWSIGDAQPLRIDSSLNNLMCPRISADGQRIVVLSGDDIYQIDGAGTPEIIAYNDPGLGTIFDSVDISFRCPVQLSDDGNMVAYRARRDGEGSDYHVHVTDLSQGKTTWLDQGLVGDVMTYDMSADGQHVLFNTAEIVPVVHEYVTEDVITRLYLMALSDQGNPTLLEQTSTIDDGDFIEPYRSIALSRDGSTIVLTELDPENDSLEYVIRVMRADGTDARIIRDENMMYSLSLTF